jgi:hypothetical protein
MAIKDGYLGTCVSGFWSAACAAFRQEYFSLHGRKLAKLQRQAAQR